MAISRGLQRKILIFVILLVAVAILTGLMSMKQPPEEKEVDNRDPLVEVLALEPMNENFTIESQGTVQPRTETILSAEVSGSITEISPSFVAGGVFSAGEVLLRIDATNYEVAVSQAEALVRQRQIEYDGAARLRSQGYRAESEYASAAAALASAQAQLVRAERDLERTYIRLPYDGIVRSKETDLGQYVGPGTRLGMAFATDVAEVRLPLTDLDLAFVDLPNVPGGAGPSVVLTTVQRGQLRHWPASIVRTEGVVDERSRVTYAVAEVTDPYGRGGAGEPLPMGTFVTASIEGSMLDGVVRVPRSALRGSDQLVFLDEESRLRIRSVEVVRSDTEYAYVRDGAQAGQRIVVTPMDSPINGASVRTTDDPEETTDDDPTSLVSSEGSTGE